MNQDNSQSNYLTTEGDELYYEIRGQGKPLLMIPGGGGDGNYYALVADILANEYKVITYDRRANAHSTMNSPDHFEISQQSRDAVAVLQAAGENSAFVFGNSSGAVIALDMAKTQPQAVRAVIAHEAPLACVHRQAPKWLDFFNKVYQTAFRFGSSLAALRFLLGIQVPVWKLISAQRKADKELKSSRIQSDQRRIPSRAATDFLIKQELLPVTNYVPDVETIRQNGVVVFMAVGKWGLDRKAWYVEVAQILAEELDCELVVFPGHHGSFMDIPAEWAASLRTILHRVDGEGRKPEERVDQNDAV